MFWSDQNSFPPNEIFTYPDTAYYQQRPNGFYICLKSTLSLNHEHDSIATIGMIPIMHHYFSALPDRFIYSNTATSKITISGLPTEYVITGLTGNVKFYVSPVTVTKRPFGGQERHLGQAIVERRQLVMSQIS